MEDKKLYRKSQGKMITGVCAGLADYFQVDANLVRALCLLLALSGPGIIGYLACTVLIPEYRDQD